MGKPDRRTTAPPSGWVFMVRALRHRNYRLFFGGQIVSLIGTWMTNVATGWLVYRLTGSALLLGAVGFAGQLPAALLSPFAGIYVDRWDRRRLLILTQTVSMAQSFLLGALTMTNAITIPLLLALCVLQGLVNAFDMPCRQAFMVDVVEDKDDLPNAIALNSSMFNAARLLGPSIGGLVIAAWGEGWCFLIDGISYLAVIAALRAMSPRARPPFTGRGDAFMQLREGWRYAFASPAIRPIVLLLAFIGLVGMPYTVLVPVFAGTVLGGGPHTLGFLMTASGAGALVAALWLAARRSVLGLGRVIPVAAVAFGAGLAAFSVSRTVWLSVLCLGVTGFGFMAGTAASNTILQTIVEEDKRGRVMSLFVMAFLGTTPFGSLLAGALSQRIGGPSTLFGGGLLCCAGGLWFYRRLPVIRQAIRPIYITRGILPAMAGGLKVAAELSDPSKK